MDVSPDLSLDNIVNTPQIRRKRPRNDNNQNSRSNNVQKNFKKENDVFYCEVMDVKNETCKPQFSSNSSSTTFSPKKGSRSEVSTNKVVIFKKLFISCSSNIKDYPKIGKIAMYMMAACSTSVPSERFFSVSGLTVNKLRTRLTPDKVNKLMVLWSWNHFLTSNNDFKNN
ncbi:unnamed protein product [Brachionus calyciflorus]|uniref:HAT C-terminal dimerisation domain-containing protein n=1 Tax=Brachionus calyciflorus TaxID=104777 RepID=A0A814GV01_9BILA|nr:unnamed protein product [Brachionus calyciflorus]